MWVIDKKLFGGADHVRFTLLFSADEFLDGICCEVTLNWCRPR